MRFCIMRMDSKAFLSAFLYIRTEDVKNGLIVGRITSLSFTDVQKELL